VRPYATVMAMPLQISVFIVYFEITQQGFLLLYTQIWSNSVDELHVMQFSANVESILSIFDYKGLPRKGVSWHTQLESLFPQPAHIRHEETRKGTLVHLKATLLACFTKPNFLEARKFQAVSCKQDRRRSNVYDVYRCWPPRRNSRRCRSYVFIFPRADYSHSEAALTL